MIVETLPHLLARVSGVGTSDCAHNPPNIGRTEHRTILAELVPLGQGSSPRSMALNFRDHTGTIDDYFLL
jgi:hypothetical protein